MSIEIKARIICDGVGCTASVGGTTGHRMTHDGEPAWTAKDAATRAGWMTIDHGRYYPNRHFCPSCQDKPLPKLPALKRRPEVDHSKCKLVGFKSECPKCGVIYTPMHMGEKCPTCAGIG